MFSLTFLKTGDSCEYTVLKRTVINTTKRQEVTNEILTEILLSNP